MATQMDDTDYHSRPYPHRNVPACPHRLPYRQEVEAVAEGHEALG